MTKLLDLSKEKSKAGGLSDISVYEEYLMLLMKGRQKIFVSDKQNSYLEVKENSDKQSHFFNPDEIKKFDIPNIDIKSISRIESKYEIDFEEKQEDATLNPPSDTEELSDSKGIYFNREDTQNITSESLPLLLDTTVDEQKQTESSFGFTNYNPVDNTNESLVESLENMGFPRKYCEIALDMCGDDPEEALNYILNNGISLEEMVQMERNNEPIEDKSSNNNFEKNLLDDMRSDNVMHYDGGCNKLLPFYSEPSFSSERLGCIYPGDDLNVIEPVDPNADILNMWYKLSYRDFDDGSYQNTVNRNLYVYIPHSIKGLTNKLY